MGTLIPAARNMIYIEGSEFRSAVSEDLLQRFGASVNFINTYVYNELFFGGLGIYGNYATGFPLLDVGSIEAFNDNSSIVNVVIQSNTQGTSGTSEFDIKWAANGSSTYASIFSTTPKVTSAAASAAIFDSNSIFSLPTGCTRPVLSKVSFNQGDKLRCDIISAMPNAADFIITIYYRAR
jgi:hypothetical protein